MIAISQLLADETEIMEDFFNEITGIFEKYYLIMPIDYGFTDEWQKNIKMSKEFADCIRKINHEYRI